MRRLWITAAVVALIAVGITGYRLWPRTAAPVYVSDGSYVFNTNLGGAENLIHRENDWVAGTGKPSVSVAVLASGAAGEQRHAVEGAYLAQYAANHPGGPKARPGVPLVRLLVAVDGSGAAAALEAAGVVAVTGSGSADLVSELATQRIPVIGTGANGTVRVTPTATDLAQAAVRLLGSSPRVWLIEDQNGGDTSSAFLRVLRSRHDQVVGPGSEYDSSVPTLAALTDTGEGVCRSKATAVYFAGLGADLRTALAGLARRSCARARHLTVVAGNGATEAAGRTLWPATGNLNVYVTGLAHPDMWAKQPAAADPATAARFDGFTHKFPGDPKALQDGWAIVSHDAVLTAVDAIHEAPTVNAATPTSAAVGQTLEQVTVHGASGYLCFDGTGDPINRTIPIEQLSASGALTYRSVVPSAANPCE